MLGASQIPASSQTRSTHMPCYCWRELSAPYFKRTGLFNVVLSGVSVRRLVTLQASSSVPLRLTMEKNGPNLEKSDLLIQKTIP